MSYKAIIPLGRMRIEVTADNERTLFERVAFFAELPERCGNPTCGGDRLRMKHRSPKGNDYYSIECADCGHEYTLGITKEDKRLFPHRRWEPPYTGDREGRSDNDDRTHHPARRESGPVPTQQGEPAPQQGDHRPERDYPPSKGHGRPYGA